MDGSLSTALILGAVALSEGIRATPPGAVVLRRTLAGPWTREEPLALGRGFTLPSPVSPFTVAVMVPPATADGDARQSATRLRDRMERVASVVTWLRLLGATSLVALVAGVPGLTARSGWFGLVAALAMLLVLSIAQAVIVHRALRRLGVATPPAMLTAAKILWPFTTPRSAELVLDAVVTGAPPLVAAHVLLSGTEFRRSMRALAYDVVHERADASREALQALLEPAELRAMITSAPDGAERFCPRCAAGYAPGIRHCAECEGVAIVGA